MKALTHSADNVQHCARAVELVVAGPCFVGQCWFGSFLADQLQSGKGVSFAIGDVNTKIVPKNALYCRLTRQASPLLPSRQTLASNGSLCIQEFVFEVRFNISSKNGHYITNQCER